MHKISIKDNIYPNINPKTAFPELEAEEKEAGFNIKCPCCKRREAFIHKNSGRIYCHHRNSCGLSITYWEYIREYYNINDNRDIFNKLCELAGISLNYNSDSDTEFYEKHQKLNTLSEISRISKQMLWQYKDTNTHAGSTFQYLIKERFYTEEEIDSLDFGYFDYYTIESILNTKQLNIASVGLSTTDTYPLLIPYKDKQGNIISFVRRAIDKNITSKYIYCKGFSAKKQFFNMDRINTGKKEMVIIVEGFLDALTASTRGFDNIIATGGSNISENQVKDAMDNGIKLFVLCLDNDEAGIKGTKSSTEIITRLGGVCTIVKLPPNIKDVDELLNKAGGQNILRQCLDNSISVGIYKAEEVINEFDFSKDIDREMAIIKAIEVSNNIVDKLNNKEYWDTLCEILCISYEHVEDRVLDYTSRLEKEKKEIEINNLDHIAKRQLNNKEYTNLKSTLEEIENIKHDLNKKSSIIEPTSYERLVSQLRKANDGLTTGYEELDKYITIQEGSLTLIAGRPSHGKTTLMMNMFLRMIRKYEDKKFFFFSYEEPYYKIGIKLINILNNYTHINNSISLKYLESYIKYNIEAEEKINEIEKGIELFDKYCTSERLNIIDEGYEVIELCKILENLKNKYGNNLGAIYIDYIQKIRINSKKGTRQLEIQDISNKILRASIDLSIPIILGAQFNREVTTKNKVNLDCFREAGDLEQDANLVLGIWNEGKENNSGQEHTANIIANMNLANFYIKILKNRDGEANREIKLYIEGAKTRILEQTEIK